MARHRVLRALICGCLTATAATTAWAGVDLRPRLEKGGELLFDASSVTEQTMLAAEIPGGSAAQTVRQSSRIRLVVDSVDESSAAVRARYETLKYELAAPIGMGTQSFDSTRPAEQDGSDTLAAALRPLVNEWFTFTVSPTGQVSNVLIPDRMRRQGPMGAVSASLTDPEAVRLAMESMIALPGFPESKEVGDVWSTTSEAPMESRHKAVTRTNLTLAGVDGAIASIKSTGDVAIQGPHGTRPLGTRVTRSDISGEAEWDTTKGAMISMRQFSSFELFNEPRPGTIFTVKLKSETELKRVGP